MMQAFQQVAGRKINSTTSSTAGGVAMIRALRLAALALLIVTAPLVRAQTGAIQNHCFLGATAATTSGLNSSNYLNGIIPSCKVTVYLSGTETLTSAFYTSGGSVAGTQGQTCIVTFSEGSPAGSGTVTLTATNTIAPKTPITITSGGSNYTYPPTSATLSSGTATCSGTASVTSVLGSSKATIYADGSNTPLSNPFYANAVYGVDPGGWTFWAATNQGYDIVMSGGIPPNAYATPVTLVDQYPSEQFISVGVTSVFGRTGVVVAETGDYTCLQVTNCGQGAGTDWTGTLTAAQGASDTTASISLAAGELPPSGVGTFRIGSEWESFTGVVSLGGGDYTLTGITRGVYVTTPAAYSPGTGLTALIFAFGAPSQDLGTSLLGGSDPVFSINCFSPSSFNGEISFTIACPSSGFSILTNGAIYSVETAKINQIQNLAIGSSITPGSPNNNLDLAYTLTHSANILREDLPSIASAGLGFPNGISGPVESAVPPNAAAPLLLNNFAEPVGSATNTYECVGIDDMGNSIIGATASIGNLSSGAFTSGNVGIQCPPIPGAVTTQIWRTVGGVNPGLVSTGGNPASAEDNNAALSGTVPSSTTAIPHVCVDGTQFCILSGTSTTPPVACSSSTFGWEYHDVAATASPFVYHCVSGASSWSTAY